MSGRSYTHDFGYHEMGYPPPDLIAEFLDQPGAQVEVIRLDRVDADAECASNALVLLRKRQFEH